MIQIPYSVSAMRQLGRRLVAAPLVVALALGYSASFAQVAPKPEPARKTAFAEPICYVDGKLTAFSRFSKLDQSAIATLQVLTGDAEIKTFGSTTTGGTILVTTKAKANSLTVLAFDKRIQGDVPLKPATPEQEAAIAAATAYLTQTYPRAKLEALYVLQTLPATYKAIFTESGKRVSLHFDSNGHALK